MNEISILDVGCGGGVLLHKVKDMIPQSLTYGVEPNELYAKLARNKSGAIEIKTDYFSRKVFNHGFDVILLCDVLEHVESPIIFLRDIYSSLNENGIVFIEVPSPTNFDRLEPSHDIFNVAHHVFYTEEVLNAYLVNSGFTDINITDIEYKNNAWKLRAIAKK